MNFKGFVDWQWDKFDGFTDSISIQISVESRELLAVWVRRDVGGHHFTASVVIKVDQFSINDLKQWVDNNWSTTSKNKSFAIFWIYFPAWILKLPFVHTSLAHRSKKAHLQSRWESVIPQGDETPQGGLFVTGDTASCNISISKLNWTFPILMVQKSQGQPPFGCIKLWQNNGISTTLHLNWWDHAGFLVAINSSAKDIFVVPCWEVTKVTGLQLGEQGSSDRHLYDRMPRDAWWKW